MKETEQILALWRASEARGDPAVLATVVKTQGSSYRLPGARLLVTPTGQHAGSISGGCLEEDLLKKAWWMTASGPAVRRYDTTAEGEIGPAYGLGCNGIIHVMVERLIPGEPNVLDLIAAVHEEREPVTVAHLLDSPGIAERVSPKYVSGRDVFIETITPPIRLLVFGAGEDAISLTGLAKYLGWKVSVFDGRAHYARRERFPLADEVVVRAPGSGPLSMDEWTVAILMSHSYSQDLGMLQELAENLPRYLGILGPRKRTLQLLQDAGFDESRFAPALHAPIGLDIGADGPEQVALSVIAEIQASLNERSGGELRERQGSIHARDEDFDSPFRKPTIVCA